MKKTAILLLLLCHSAVSPQANAETKISQLPLLTGADVGASDYCPFVSVSSSETARILLSDLFTSSNTLLGILNAARLPTPTSSTLGGIKSYAAVTNEWINAISTAGVPSSARPACASLSNAAASCSTDTTSASNISSGTLAKARGGAGADMSSVTFPSSGTLVTAFSNSSVVCDTGNGSGSSSTKIRRFSNCTVTGSDITYPGDSSTLGAVFTIATAGIYSITYSDATTAGNGGIGISVNSAALTTSVASIPVATRLAYMDLSAGTFVGQVSAVVRAAVNDVIRPHTSGTPNQTTDLVQFRIIRIF